MWNGWLTVGGEEIFNIARTQAYIDAGLLPPGLNVQACDSCDNLLDIVNEGKPYISPLVDNAPWLDSSQPETYDFAGLIPLEITGLDGSTRTATLTERAGDGGVTSRVRYGGRTVAVTALLVGKNDGAISAGMRWLSTVLGGSACRPGQLSPGPCAGDEMCVFAYCPDEEFQESPVYGFRDTTDIPLDVMGWTVRSARWSVGLVTPDRIGNPEVISPEIQCYEGAVFDWQVTTLAGPVTITPSFVDCETGAILMTGDPVTVQGDLQPVRLVPDPTWTCYRARFTVPQGTPRFQITPVVDHFAYQTPEECADQITRSYLNTTCVDGPTVVEEIGLSCDVTLLKVEWTWYVASPGILGAITPLAIQANTKAPEDADLAFGVGFRLLGTRTRAATTDVCAVPQPPALSKISDPCCVQWVAPPASPQVTDACLDMPTSFRRFVIEVPALYMPQVTEGALTFTVVNDTKPKKGLRLRLYPDPLARGAEAIEECAFCEEFTIAYLPASATMTLNGWMNTVRTQLPGQLPITSTGQVRGPGGGPFRSAMVQCNMAYVVTVDVGEVYSDNCPPTYLLGYPQGDVTVALDLRPLGR